MISDHDACPCNKCVARRAAPPAAAHEPMPTVNEQLPIQDLVIADIQARKAVGLKKYGTLLQPFNGRHTLMDAYQEVLDQAQYIRQALEEDNQLAAALEQLIERAEASGVNVRPYQKVLDAYRAGNPAPSRG